MMDFSTPDEIAPCVNASSAPVLETLQWHSTASELHADAPRDLLCLPPDMDSKSALARRAGTHSYSTKAAMEDNMPTRNTSPQIPLLAERSSSIQDTLDDVSKDLNYKIAELAGLVADLPRRLLGSREIGISESHPTYYSNANVPSSSIPVRDGSKSYDSHLSLPRADLPRKMVSIATTSPVGGKVVFDESSRLSGRASVSTQHTAYHTKPAHKKRGSFLLHHMKGTFLLNVDSDTRREIPLTLEGLFAVVIACNAVFMGYTLHYHSQFGHQLSWAPVVDLIFCIAFLVELLFRVAYLKMNFWFGHRREGNIFDFIVVLCMVFDEFLRRMADPENDDPSYIFSTLRIFRVARVLRTIKILHYFEFARPGRLVLLSIKAALGTFSCILALLVVLVYLLALIMTSGALDHCTTVKSEHHLLCLYFGTLWRSWYSGYQALLGGIRWGALVDESYKLGAPYAVIFVSVTTFLVTALMHIFTGIFVWIVRDASDREKASRVMKNHLEERQAFMEKMKMLFDEVDLNANGALSKEELHLGFMNKKINALFIEMELDTIAAENVFEILDVDSSGFVNIDEFAFGCLRLRGKARAVDLERARRDLVEIRTTLEEIKLTVARISGDQDIFDKVRQQQANASKQSLRPEKTKVAMAASTNKATIALEAMKSFNTEVSMKKWASETAKSQVFSRIQDPGLRAMTVDELQGVVTLVRELCYNEAWTEPRNGKALEASEVNLYHLNFHFISPQTSADCITLLDMMQMSYRRGQILTQVHVESGQVIGKAQVLEDSVEAKVQVKLLKGRFIAEETGGHASSYRMILDHDECSSLDCGMPSKVIQDNSLSYKELISPLPAKPQWFVSHWWGEPIIDFVRCCQEHSARRGADKYWVCAYANRQHDLGADIGDDPENSSFRKAMAHAEGLLLVLDPSAIPFQRLWCCFELFKTVTSDKMLDIVTMKQEPRLLTQKPLPDEQAIMKFFREQEFPLGVLSKGIQVRLENGSATMQDDKDRILQSMGKDVSTGAFSEALQQRNIDIANRRLRGYMAVAAWPQAIKRGRVLNFDKKSSEAVSLPEILAQDSDRSTLEMFFSGMQEVSDIEVLYISQGLPSNLTSLSLSFEGCTAITDAGLNCLADRMSLLPLQKLVLDFSGCKLLTDASILYLSTRLPPALVDVSLQFASIPNISKRSAKSLADHLPASVSRLRATFRGTQFDHQIDTPKKLKKMTQLFE